MLCDPHDARLDEIIFGFVQPVAIMFAVALAAMLILYKRKKWPVRIAYLLAIALTIAFLTYPTASGLSYMVTKGDYSLLSQGPIAFPFLVLFGNMFLAFGCWIASPILVLFCIWARGDGRLDFVGPFGILIVGSLVGYLWANELSNTC